MDPCGRYPEPEGKKGAELALSLDCPGGKRGGGGGDGSAVPVINTGCTGGNGGGGGGGDGDGGDGGDGGGGDGGGGRRIASSCEASLSTSSSSSLIRFSCSRLAVFQRRRSTSSGRQL